MTSVVAVVGTIPGAGTTTVVSALGAALGEQRQRVALVDATEEGSRIADAISIAGGGDLTDALRRGTPLGDVQAAGPHDVTAFPADPDTNWGSIRPDAVASLYEQLRGRFDVALVDCGSSLSPASSAWLGHADEGLIVTDPDVAGTIPETVALADAFSVPIRGVLANRVPPTEVEDAIAALEATDQPVVGVLPEDPTVGAAEADGVSVLRAEPDSRIATCAWEFARRFRDDDHAEPVLPFRAGQPAAADTAADDAAADDADDESTSATPAGDDPDSEAEPPADAAGDRAGTSGDAASDQPDTDESSETEDDSTGGATADAPDPAPAPAATAGRSSADAGEDESPEPNTAEEDENGQPTTDDDPFTAPDPKPAADSVEDAPTTENRGEETPDEHASRDPAPDEPLDGLLGDVKDRIGAPDEADPAPADAGADDAPPSEAVDDPSGNETADDASAAGTTDDERGGTAAGSDEGARNEETDDAALSDEEIETVFEETMDRVQRQRDAERAEDDGDGGDE